MAAGKLAGNFLLNKKNSFLVLFILIIFGAFLRLWNISSDPSIFLDSGQVGDEGYWLYNARNFVLFGEFAKDNYYHDLAGAPLFSFFSYLSFLFFGVGYIQGRIVSAIAGIIILIFTYLIAKRIGRKVGIVSTFLVAINTMLLMHNRLAVGESTSIAFALIGFYFLTKREILFNAKSGLFFVLSLLAKTASFLYLPSVGLILLLGNERWRDNLKLIFAFSISFFVFFFLLFGFLLLKWGEQIGLIYSTFGPWYIPLEVLSLWQNVFNFFIHPYWGSPFLFSILILAILNSLNFILYKKERTYERKFLILWIIGIAIFGPLISILSNARLLGLIVPISILGAQTIVNPKIGSIQFSKVSFNFLYKKFFFPILIIAVSAPVSIIIAKFLLAIFKRLTENETIVNNLPIASFFLLFFLFFSVRWKNNLFTKLLKIDLYLLIFLPIASFIPLFWSYLHFFELAQPVKTTHVSLITAFSFIVFYILFFRGVNAFRITAVFLTVYIFFNLIGIASIFVNPSYKIKNASNRLGQIVGSNSLIGFYGQALSIENRSKPIYWAPNLKYAEDFNSDWQRFNPEFLLVSRVFDSRLGSIEAWPTKEDVNLATYKITTLDLTRKFWRAEREFRLDVYGLSD